MSTKVDIYILLLFIKSKNNVFMFVLFIFYKVRFKKKKNIVKKNKSNLWVMVRY